MILRLFTLFLVLLALAVPAKDLRAAGPNDLLEDENGRSFDTYKGFKLKSSKTGEGEIRYAFSAPGDARLDVVLVPRNDEADCFGRSPSFNIFSQTVSGKHDPDETALLMHEILRRLAINDNGLISLGRKSAIDENRLLSEHLKVREKKDFTYHYLFVLCSLLILGALAALPRLGGILRHSFSALSAGERWLLLATTLLGLLLRVAAPYRMVQLYSGYALTSDALWFNHVPRYGAGWYVFFNHLFKLLPPDHLSIIWVNVVLSSLAVPLLAALSCRIFNYRGTALFAAVMAALHPLFVKDAVSESMFPLTMFWFLGALLFVSAWIEKRKSSDLLGGTVLFALVMLSRPLTALFPLIALLMLLPQKGFFETVKSGWKLAALLTAIAFALSIPHFMHLLTSVEQNTFPYHERLIESLLVGHLHFVSSFNLLWNPSYTPLFMWPLLAAGLVFLLFGQGRLAALGPLAAALLLFSVYTVDQPPPSMPRLQIPSQMMLLPLMAAGAALLFEGLRNILRRSRASLTILALTALLTLTASLWPPYLNLWRLNNSDEEEFFLREVEKHLPDETFILVRRDMSDKPQDYVDCAFPDYRMVPPQKRGAVMGIGEFLRLYSSGAVRNENAPDHLYFYVGTRCYAQQRDRGLHYDNWRMHPECEDMFQRLILRAVLEKDAVNHPETYQRYPSGDRLHLGLYRIEM